MTVKLRMLGLALGAVLVSAPVGIRPKRRARPQRASDPRAAGSRLYRARRAQRQAAAALRGESAGGRAERAHRPHRRYGLRPVERLRRADPYAHRRSARQRRTSLQRVPHDRALLADAHRAAHRPQPPHEQHGRHHRDRDRLSRQYRAAPERDRPARRNAAPQRLFDRRLRQEPRDGRLGDSAYQDRPTAGRPAPASTSSTAFSAARPTSGRPRSTRT